jgi:cytochrome c5
MFLPPTTGIISVPLKARHAIRALIFYALVAAASSHAFHPISTKLDFNSRYPTYPQVDYGSGGQAKAARRGEYLAKLGDCLACHTTTEGGAAFAGGLPIPTPFGTFYTPNITPDPNTGLGQWSEADFLQVMTQGIRADGSNSFPAFPYVYFNRVTEPDLKDIWAYLRVIPAVTRENQGNTLPFPMNLRLAQYSWKIPFFYPSRGEFLADASKSDAWNRGAYLVEGLGHCSMCHTPMNLLGASKKKYYLTGALIGGYWAPDISKRGLETASRYQVADVFHEGELINEAGSVRGPMADANHNSLQYLTDEDALAIAEYLKSVQSKQPRNVTEQKARQPRLVRGEQVFWNACDVCHVDGQASAPRIKDADNWWQRLEQRPVSALYRNAIHGFNNMPARGACVTCDNEDVEAAVDYIIKKALTASQWREYTNKVTLPRIRTTDSTTGESVYRASCATCHDKGQLGAPVLGNRQQWDARLRKNFDELLHNTLQGYNAMPAKGGCTSCTGEEVIAAVKYMAEKAQPTKDYSLW